MVLDDGEEYPPDGMVFELASTMRFFVLRDRMNAEVHLGNVRWSPITLSFAITLRDLFWRGVFCAKDDSTMSVALEELVSAYEEVLES